MPTSKPTEYRITRPAQVRALISPVRQEIVDALQSAGPCSIADLAGHLGRPADALYFHLRTLSRVGLVIEVERRKEGRHVFVVYDVPARRMRLSYDPPNRPADVTRVVSSILRLASRDFTRAMSSGNAITKGPNRNLWGARAKGWAMPRDLERINALLHELSELVNTGKPQPGAAPISLSFALCPVEPNARATKPDKPARKSKGVSA